MLSVLNISPLTATQGLDKCTVLFSQKDYNNCLALAQEMSGIHPENIDFKYVAGLCYKELEQHSEAEILLLESLAQAPNSLNVLFNLGLLYSSTKNIPQAIFYYEKAFSIDQNHVGLLNNLANIYNEIGRNSDALQLFNRILELGYNKSFIYNNIALIYKRLGRMDEALAYIKKAIDLKSNDYREYHTAALILMAMADNKQAILCLEKALEINPNNIQLNYEYADLLNKVCDWDKCEAIQSKIKQLISVSSEIFVISPMSDIQHNIDPAHNLAVARKFTDNAANQIFAITPQFQFGPERKTAKAKIRIGYLSSDIKDHPVAHLMRGVFQNHNKNEFEVYLYSSSGSDKSGYKDAIKSCCDKFIDIGSTANTELARLLYNDNIDILIDLNGHTGQSRLEALCLKPAPVQVNYIGYIGSMGADFIDYIITDKTVTPEDQQQFYTEKFAYLPDCYQANDNTLKISSEHITRQAEGLPENKFVFCSFNQTTKIEPVMFTAWMNILKRVPDSVLWLYKGSIYKNHSLASYNLQKEAQKHGVDPVRLIFAEAIYIDKHLKRKSLANLALDTRIYNGGTVTSQTLWAGLPVLTLQGGHFASRMASSILAAAGLPELVTTNLKDYEDLAVELATNPEKLTAIRNKLSNNLASCNLFNTAKFTANIEQLYKLMWQNYCNGNLPKIIEV